jgi:DNA-binding SARP family transcriptional activator
MEFCLLGPLLVSRRGVTLSLRPRKQRAMLKALPLAAGAGCSHSTS